MSFANNLEAMAFDKGGWNRIEISANGEEVYMGKPSTNNASDSDPVWCIKRVTTLTGKDGSQHITIQYAQPAYRCKWTDKEDYEYKYHLS